MPFVGKAGGACTPRDVAPAGTVGILVGLLKEKPEKRAKKRDIDNTIDRDGIILQTVTSKPGMDYGRNSFAPSNGSERKDRQVSSISGLRRLLKSECRSNRFVAISGQR